MAVSGWPCNACRKTWRASGRMNCWKTWARTCGRLSTSFLCAVSMTAQTAPMFRASVALVHVDAEVTLEGRTLAGLTKDDFRVLDERRPQTVVQFASEEQALDLIRSEERRVGKEGRS